MNLNVQTVIVEKDPSPSQVSRPWRYRCTEGIGPFNPHIQCGFKTKERALEVAMGMMKFIAQSVAEKAEKN